METTVKGFGFCLQIGDGETYASSSTFADVMQAKEVTPPAPTLENIDTSHAKSEDETRTFIRSWSDPGEATVMLQYNAANIAQLRAIYGENRGFRILFATTGAEHRGGVGFSGFVSAIGTPVDVEDLVMVEVTIKCSGPTTDIAPTS